MISETFYRSPKCRYVPCIYPPKNQRIWNGEEYVTAPEGYVVLRLAIRDIPKHFYNHRTF
jgi:hypothetical protein